MPYRDDRQSVLEICEDYPQELVWAINEAKITSLGPHVVSLLERYKNDAYLLNRMVQCLMRLGDTDAIALSMRRAAELLTVPGAMGNPDA
jgi:hypothetical protein